jgi:hypothetical protein
MSVSERADISIENPNMLLVFNRALEDLTLRLVDFEMSISNAKILDIDNFCLLESQKNGLFSDKMFLLLYNMFNNLLGQRREVANLQELYRGIYNRLKAYGLSDTWITQLKNKVNETESVNDFRIKFIHTIDLLLTKMLLPTIDCMDSSIPKEQRIKIVINNIFDDNRWVGSVAQQVNSVRALTTTLGFDRNFVIEFGQALTQ